MSSWKWWGVGMAFVSPLPCSARALDGAPYPLTARGHVELPAGRPKAVVCAGGLRSSTTISALKRQIGGPWFNVTGGMAAWVKAGYSVGR